ncbi:unnamed protein product [Bemisia tabaci]|uniref:Cathepsin propeptide inhibitor domain-containing protein n=1 Tax=Bemisia tabaci TaxID=7038 RepID=A0A9P0AIF7_BEMTA|nr:unnamed protein product [Bemisia tabaci]
MECDPKGPDPQSCSGHCNALWGRVPLYNIPWTRGECQKGICVCTFNAQELNPLMLQTCDQKWCVYCSGGSSAPATCPSQRSMAEQKIKAKISCLSVGQRFEVFKETYGRKYGSQAEEKYRFEVFKANLATIDELQAEGGGSVSFGIGPYADRTTTFRYVSSSFPVEANEASKARTKLAVQVPQNSVKNAFNSMLLH